MSAESLSTPTGTYPYGQMYVEWEAPESPSSRRYPIVLIHGGGGQGLDYLCTPDGRPGWAPLLVKAGYTVYVVDRPGHGRSPHDPKILGAMGDSLSVETWLGVMAPTGQTTEHTQWPGGRTPEDTVVTEGAASAGPRLANWEDMHALEQSRLSMLLDRIGPSIVLCHSSGGPAGYLTADARPELVKVLIAIETIGPPFMSRGPGETLQWGLSAAQMHFEPEAQAPEDLVLVEDHAHRPVPRIMQQEPARKLTKLAKVPIGVVTSPTSPLSHFSDHTVDFLRQAGCQVTHLKLLEDFGISGNGHAMMWELNHQEVLDHIMAWAEKTVS